MQLPKHFSTLFITTLLSWALVSIRSNHDTYNPENHTETRLLIHEADPQSRPIVITIFTHVVPTSFHPSVRFKAAISRGNHCRPSGSLMTPVLFSLSSCQEAATCIRTESHVTWSLRNFDSQLGVLPTLFTITFFWSTRPTTVPAASDHYFHTECPSVRPKTSESSDNPCRPGLWAGRVDHWWLQSCLYFFHMRLRNYATNSWLFSDATLQRQFQRLYFHKNFTCLHVEK